MATQAQKETLGYTADVNKLLDLMISSIYGNQEIAIRELISNSSDALDKLRFEALSDAALLEKDPDLNIHLEFDKKSRTITISDNGVGMSREEIISNLGTIAKSGTHEFLESLTGDQAKDSALIGQFGVGFYSSFIISKKVEVRSRRAGLTKEHGVCWVSDGKGKYSIENIERKERGTQVILHLKKGLDEFLEDWRLRNIVKKYSDHIASPIVMKKIKTEAEDKKAGKNEDKKETSTKDEKEPEVSEWETVNRAQAIWTLPKDQIKKEDYRELYKHISHDFEDPLLWLHNRVEGKLEYISLLYVPSRAPFDLWDREHQRGLKLYVNRVFVMDDVEQFLPMYLRFVKGIIDTNDLPLNISREILQDNPALHKIRSTLVKRILGLLSKLSKNNDEQYKKFWKEFGKVLKEGPAEDFSNREDIAKLLRFSSTHLDNEEQTVSLEDYVSRMSDGQDKIYYITADSFMAAQHSPHLEIFREKGIEVLLLCDRVDEWLVTHLTEFDGKTLQSVAKGDLDLGEKDDKEVEVENEKQKDDFASMLKQIKEILGDKIKEARLTHRLTNSPACIVADQYDMNLNMQRLMKAVGQNIPTSKPIFELNPEHALVQRLKGEPDDNRFKEWVKILFDQAILAEGGQLEDPATFVSRLNEMLLELAR